MLRDNNISRRSDKSALRMSAIYPKSIAGRDTITTCDWVLEGLI